MRVSKIFFSMCAVGSVLGVTAYGTSEQSQNIGRGRHMGPTYSSSPKPNSETELENSQGAFSEQSPGNGYMPQSPQSYTNRDYWGSGDSAYLPYNGQSIPNGAGGPTRYPDAQSSMGYNFAPPSSGQYGVNEGIPPNQSYVFPNAQPNHPSFFVGSDGRTYVQDPVTGGLVVSPYGGYYPPPMGNPYEYDSRSTIIGPDGRLYILAPQQGPPRPPQAGYGQ
jgi:hypothetical protein